MRDSTKQKLVVFFSTGGGFISGILRFVIKTNAENIPSGANSSSNLKNKISSLVVICKQLIEFIPVANKSPGRNIFITTSSGFTLGLMVVVISKFLHKETLQKVEQLEEQQRATEGTTARVLAQLVPTTQELERTQANLAAEQQRNRELEERNSRLASDNKRLKDLQDTERNSQKLFAGAPRQRAERQTPVPISLVPPAVAMTKTG